MPGHLPGPRVERDRRAVLPRLPDALTALDSGANTNEATADAVRYPRWLMAMVLPWLPITAVLFFFTVPRGDEIVCLPDTCALESHRGFVTHRSPVTNVSVENDADTKRPVLVVYADDMARFDLRDGVAPAFATYTESRTTKSPAHIPVGGRSWWWMFGGMLVSEIILILYFTFARVRPSSAST